MNPKMAVGGFGRLRKRLAASRPKAAVGQRDVVAHHQQVIGPAFELFLYDYA